MSLVCKITDAVVFVTIWFLKTHSACYKWTGCTSCEKQHNAIVTGLHSYNMLKAKLLTFHKVFESLKHNHIETVKGTIEDLERT